jgi:hypothetical protein
MSVSKAVKGALKKGVKRAAGKALGTKGGTKAVGGAKRLAGNIKAAGGIAKLEGKDAARKVAKKAANAVGVVAGSNFRKAKAVVSATSGKTKSAAVKNMLKQGRKTMAARAGIAAVGAAGVTAANAKTTKKTSNKYVTKAKSKLQSGYKMVYGKLKRVGRSK